VNANAFAITLVAATVLVLVVANQRQTLADALDVDGDGSVPLPDGAGEEQGQGGGDVQTVLATLDPTTYFPPMTDDDTQNANVQAGLLTIRTSEGTAGDDGYRTMFGYRMFDSFADHPRQPAQFNSNGKMLWTSAAGAYQMMAISPIPGGGSTRVDTWDRMKAKLNLPDFSPASQDAAALALISDAGALNDLKAGRFDTFVSKVRGIWASLPGAGYGQPERTLDSLRTAFVNAGGTLST
jgi:muramidase (phage lysozyme)